MIGSLTRNDIDLRARQLATEIREVKQRAADFKAFLDTQLAAGTLTDPQQGGYPTDPDHPYVSPGDPGQPGPELAALLGASDEWAYWAGTLAESYGKSVPSLWDAPRGQV